MGRLSKIDFLKVIERLKGRPDGSNIEVTAITLLLSEKVKAQRRRFNGRTRQAWYLNVGGALRQPSGGPTMNGQGNGSRRR